MAVAIVEKQVGNSMKWFKRVILFVVGLALALGAVGVGAYVYGVRGTPEWVRRPFANQEEQTAAAGRVDQKIMETLSMVREMDAFRSPESTTQASGDKRPVAAQAVKRLKVNFTEDELNAAFQKWDRLYGWTERYRHHVQEPSIVLHEGRIVLAGQAAELNTVVSVHFEPKLAQDGQLDLRLSRVLAGRLPLPQAFFDKYRDALRAKLTATLPELQREAELKADGSANTEATSAAMAQLFLHVLANEPAESVLFLPVGQKRSVPVRLTDVSIEQKTLSLTVKPLNADERAKLMEEIREQSIKATARGGDSGTPTRVPRGS